MCRPGDAWGEDEGDVHDGVPEGDEWDEVVELVWAVHHQAQNHHHKVDSEHDLQMEYGACIPSLPEQEKVGI